VQETRSDPPMYDERLCRAGMKTNSSRHLLQQAQHGDRDAVDALLRRYVPSLQRWASGRLPRARKASETDDLVHDTVMRTLSRRDALELRHEGALSYLRQAIITRIVAAGHNPTPGDRASGSPLDEAIGREAVERYEKALGRLVPEEREAFIARVELDYSYDDVANAVGCSSADEARMAVIAALLHLAEEMRRGA
jgi:DNA-directed RNA polymerase specialized sigma24 family protein